MTNIINAARLLTTAVLVLLIPSVLAGQQNRLLQRPTWADSAPARLLNASKHGLPSDAVLDVLRQRRQPYTAEKRRELADSIEARAIADGDHRGVAIMNLETAGSSSAAYGGTPDASAPDRLIHVRDRITDPSSRTNMLHGLLDQIEPTRALPYFNSVITTADERGAFFAVMDLAQFAFGSGSFRGIAAEQAQAESLLHQLFEENLAKTAQADDALCRIGIGHKWSRHEPCHIAP